MKRRVLLNQVVSLRNWAKADPDAEQAAQLRSQATELVDAIRRYHPDDERTLAQKSLLRLDAGELDEAHGEIVQLSASVRTRNFC